MIGPCSRKPSVFLSFPRQDHVSGHLSGCQVSYRVTQVPQSPLLSPPGYVRGQDAVLNVSERARRRRTPGSPRICPRPWHRTPGAPQEIGVSVRSPRPPPPTARGHLLRPSALSSTPEPRLGPTRTAGGAPRPGPTRAAGRRPGSLYLHCPRPSLPQQKRGRHDCDTRGRAWPGRGRSRTDSTAARAPPADGPPPGPKAPITGTDGGGRSGSEAAGLRAPRPRPRGAANHRRSYSRRCRRGPDARVAAEEGVAVSLSAEGGRGFCSRLFHRCTGLRPYPGRPWP